VKHLVCGGITFWARDAFGKLGAFRHRHLCDAALRDRIAICVRDRGTVLSLPALTRVLATCAWKEWTPLFGELFGRESAAACPTGAKESPRTGKTGG